MDPLEKIIFAATFAFTASLFVIFYYIVSKNVLENIYLHLRTITRKYKYTISNISNPNFAQTLCLSMAIENGTHNFITINVLSELTYLSNPNGKK